ncbi:MAG: Spx/MgsR family RNA polymerase-binding regulatory protein [Bacteroidetes bacterium]|nr:Spx/MgsR family RNA polymerase-binding regulatory protein [Bacteroidota bacterium]MDA1268023.1 Spx/MgsR family RNA polymerase-binding regulatory protein [Bacteroidota bacterium]
MALKVYGIKNCNTMKKTFTFLEASGISYEFIDYKKKAPDADLLRAFLTRTTLEFLINRQGTTYKKLGEEQKVSLKSESTALPLLMGQPSMIKRPLIIYPDGSLTLGFVAEQITYKLQ